MAVWKCSNGSPVRSLRAFAYPYSACLIHLLRIKMLNNLWLQGFPSCPCAVRPVLVTFRGSVPSWLRVLLSQRCLAIAVEQKCFLLVIEITPYHYLSACYKTADRFQIPVVKDNALPPCPALLVCSRTANAVPMVLGGSFPFSTFMTRNKKMKSCVKLRKLQKPGRGWLSPGQFVSSRGMSEVSF